MYVIQKYHVAKKIQIIEVKMTAPIVPTGIDFCGSDKSPDLFEPDIKPSKNIKNTMLTVKKTMH